MNIGNLSSLFRAVSDPVRLRLLQLLSAEELSVGELVRILDLPQSSVSRHLKALKEEGLVADRPEGPATYYRASIEADVGDGETHLRDALAGMLREGELSPADRDGLARVLALRTATGDQFFDRIGLRWDVLREECFGPTFHLEAFIGLLPADWTVADLGTGTGYLLPVLGRHFQRVVAVDNSRAMLDLAERRVTEAGVQNRVELKEGTLEQLPLSNGEVDLAVALLMLHHLPDVPAALVEVARVLKPDGQLLVVDLHEHTNETFRVRMADRRSGIAPAQLYTWLQAAGFQHSRHWDLPEVKRPEHELAPLPRLYAAVATATSESISQKPNLRMNSASTGS